MKPRRRIGTTVAAGLVAAVALTSANAWFGARGTGQGSAPTGAAAAVTVSPGVVGAALYPGGSAPVALQIANPNPGPVHVGRITLDPTRGSAGFAVDAAHPTCATGSLTLGPSDNGGPGWTVPGRGTLTISLAGALSAGPTLPSSCQGATLTIYLTAT